ncbi:thiol reductase thioredoxin [Mycolicibacterium madagascariense]|uniref:Thiol reductase thioredoxin n=1 Tax=Mycolicibacterium madagascariense TaxID=212765 RepID=A0A7I7XME5_9MYCO|nr:thioredoxin family protein [Mycolicibacterium madagascariense]MCV7013087.1 thioredoxin family protein [Mycolicibacterium madagascariense]BBZ30394.1 thiol reductase thioredoxin [Mycolicibacterium madagascariense]
MSNSVVAVGVVLIAALAVSVVVGRLLTRRDGVLRDATSGATGAGAGGLDLPAGTPAIVHFSAPWCGPCGAVRRVVDDVCATLPTVAHVELDLDANPAAARELSVSSLPTTFVFDADGQQRYRASGVPKAADLRSALQPLLA